MESLPKEIIALHPQIFPLDREFPNAYNGALKLYN